MIARKSLKITSDYERFCGRTMCLINGNVLIINHIRRIYNSRAKYNLRAILSKSYVRNKDMAYTYKYPRPAVTADCIVITKEAEPKVLLIERGDEPFKGCWAIPGGFINMDETTEQCAIRELEEETSLRVSDVHQIGAYSKVDRDPRGRTITVAYLAIVNEPITVIGQDDAAKAEWWPFSALPELAFDHADIMQDAIKIYNTLSPNC